MVNNNEKIQNLLRIKTELPPLMDKYLASLQVRYDWSKEKRSEYYKIRRQVVALAKKLSQKKRGEQAVDPKNAKLAAELEQLVEKHMSKGYKKFSGAEFIEDLRPIIQSLDSLGFSKQAEKLQNLTNIDNWKEPAYPDSVKIIDTLHEIRHPSMYIKRGYTVLKYVKPVYRRMNYFQRALREKREYVGTLRAYEKLVSAVNELEKYYKAHYEQAGGNPRNYHGHYAGEKP